MNYIKFKEFIESTQYGYTADKTSDTNGDAKYLRITDIVPYFVDKESVPYCEIDEKKRNNYIVKENDLLIARTGATTGYNLLVDGTFKNYIYASYLIRFNLNWNKLYPKYVKHVLKSNFYKNFVNSYIGGSAQPGMNAKVFGYFNFPYLKYEDQEKIGNLLSKYDELIENNNKRIESLEEMAQEIYKEWFVRFRFPGYKDYKFKEAKPKGWKFGEHYKLIPNDWKYGQLSEFGEFVRGKNITADKMEEGNIPVISAGKAPSGYHNKANVFGYSITASASGANAGYLKYNLEDIWCADASYYNNENNIRFVYNSLNFIRPVINNLQVGSAQPHVYPKDLNKLSIIIPTKDWIEKYEKLVEPMYEEIKQLNGLNKKLIEQRDLLLPRLMSGKLEIK